MQIVKDKIKQHLSIILVSLIMVIGLQVNGQDTIYVKSKNTLINAKILEVNPSNLKYKRFSNIDGPTYTIERGKIEKVIYANGEVENFVGDDSEKKKIERQASQDLMPGSRIFLTFSKTSGKDDVNGEDAKQMLKTYIKGKTSCVVVSTIDEADFEMELSVVIKIMAERKAMLTIRHIITNEEVYSTKWVRGTSNAFSGYSGSRHAIGRLVKKLLIKDYPEIAL